MPIAFFTRTPTGAITSRLNNDVVGAQTAVTNTLGSVVSNVVVLVTDARRDAVARVAAHVAGTRRPAAVPHPRSPGRPTPAADLARADAAQRGDEHPDDRALQRRRGDPREAVRRPRTRGRCVRAATPPGCATPASARRCTGGCSSSPSGSSGPSAPPRSTASAPTSWCPAASPPGTLVALAALGDTDLRTAHRADQHAGRPDDVAGQLRAGLRGARRARADRRAPGRHRPPGTRTVDRTAGSRSTGCGSATRRPPRRRSPRSSSAPPETDPDRDVLDGHQLDIAARGNGRAGRGVGRRQDDDGVAHPAPLRRHRRRRARRRPRRARPHALVAQVGDRRREPGPAPVPRVDRRQPALRQARGDPRRDRRGRDAEPGSTT